MGAPTDNDFNVFYSIKDSDKFRIVKGYLWLNNTMSEVGREVFPYDEDRSAQEKVSVVTRCYGFGGENHGVFRRWGIADTVKDSDIKSFISKYPNGCRYDDNGTEMFRFLKQSIDKRLAAERVQRQREQAALEERRRIEAEERRRQQAIEAEERRYQEQLRKQQEEEERRAREYRREQEAAKRRALSIAQEAEIAMSKAHCYEDLYAGIEKYRQAMEISWKELDFNVEEHVKKSDLYLGSCVKAALKEHQNKNYRNVLKYCSYVCDVSQAGVFGYDVDGFDMHFLSVVHKRTKEFHPEATCLSLMADVYLSMNNIDEAIRVAEYGVQAGGIRCMEILGDYYSTSREKKYVLLACYYFEMMGDVSDISLQKKRKCAQDKVITMRSDEVGQVMNAYSPDWLPLPQSNTDTWETYSNLPNKLLDKYDRISKNKDYITVRLANVPSNFEKFGYVPGQIDLSILWDAYRAAHTKTEKKLLFWKKSEYIGELREGDFVECCRYLWEKKYHNEVQVPGQEQEPVKVEPVQEEINFEHELDEEQIRREKADEYFRQGYACEKKNDTQGMLKAYLAAVDYGSAKAAISLGNMYRTGNGVEKNLERAVSLYEQSAGQGNRIGKRNLAKCYLEGIGVEKNFEKAIDLLVEAAEAGDENSGLGLVKIYGEWSHKDDNKRAYWLKKMADAGNVDCMFDLGEFYAKNREHLNEGEALKYYEKAAENGTDEMRLKVAKALDVKKYGDAGCVNLEAAKRWYCRVIAGTNDKLKLDAARGLDVLCNLDREVLREALDAAKAFDTYSLLGSSGNKEALAEAAYCKETGKGTEQDIDLAIAFYEQAGAGYEAKAEWCKKKRSGNMKDIAFLEHKNYSMPALIRDKHTNNNEYYLEGYPFGNSEEGISEYESNIYYIVKEYCMPAYLCASNDDGTDIRIIAELADDYMYANVHVNITGIYVYNMQDYDRVQIAHYNFSGALSSECKEEYPGGYEAGHCISNLRFYDSKAYFIYSNKTDTIKKAYIKCMDIDRNQVFTIYEKAAEIRRLFAIKEKLVFSATYENDDCDASWKKGWMILDLNTMTTECISNPLCNPENIVDDPEIYDVDSPRYNSGCSYDRNIVSFDFNRNIFWTRRGVLEGEDSKHLERISYIEPKSLWGDRDTVIPDLPIWRVPDNTNSLVRREYFDGTHRYFSTHYAVFKSTDINGEVCNWADSGHGECDRFKVIGDFLFLNAAGAEVGEEQYILSVERSEPIRKSWFDRKLDQEVLDAFHSKTRSIDLIPDTIHEEEQKSKNTEGNKTMADLKVEKVIGNTDVKYNICTFGSKFHIGFGVQVTIEINGKTYECKTHNSVKGRIDGMKKLFTENDIKLGDCIDACYYKDENRVVLVKK